MKKQILSVCAALLLIAAVGAVTAPAQSSTRLEASIPFDFVVGGKTLPAGDYTVSTVLSHDPSVLAIRNPQGCAIAITQGADNKKSDGTNKLVFHRYGNKYFLSQIWNEDGRVSRSLPKSKLERELMASNGTSSVVMVALNSR